MSIAEKSPDAFRTISEVAEELDLPQHVLRFWETRFSQIKPLKRGGGRRYYRPDDVELLRGIRHLLYGEGYTIKGVQRILKEQGPRFVMQVWREGAMPVPMAQKLAVREEQKRHQGPQAPIGRSMPPAEDLSADSDDDILIDEATGEPEKLPRDVLPDVDPRGPHPEGGRFRFMDRFLSDRGDHPDGLGHLGKEDVRRLQATLFELLECKRLLDQAR